MMLGVAKSIANVRIEVLVKPVLAALQLAPLFVLLKTPPVVPTYKVLGLSGSIARLSMAPPSGPILVHTLIPAEIGALGIANASTTEMRSATLQKREDARTMLRRPTNGCCNL